MERCISEFKLLFFYTVRSLILLHEKFLQVDWLIEVVFQLNLKYLKDPKITNRFRVVVSTNDLYVICGINTTREISKLSQISLA